MYFLYFYFLLKCAVAVAGVICLLVHYLQMKPLLQKLTKQQQSDERKMLSRTSCV